MSLGARIKVCHNHAPFDQIMTMSAAGQRLIHAPDSSWSLLDFWARDHQCCEMGSRGTSQKQQVANLDIDLLGRPVIARKIRHLCIRSSYWLMKVQLRLCPDVSQ